MDQTKVLEEVKAHMQMLCAEIKDRRVGSEGNRMATRYIVHQFNQAGWSVEETSLSVIDWKTTGASLVCGKESFEVFSSHYSSGCDLQAELVAIATLEELEQTDIANKIVLLHGEIAKEQIVPKGYPFYSVEDHVRIIATLEECNPIALVCATGRNSATAGGVYPFPLFEDGNFDIPSVYMKDIEGEKLLPYVGKTVRLVSNAKRIPETAFNVIARINEEQIKRIVISAHIDAKIGTPGAIDNATGVTVLLLLAKMMKDYAGQYTLELAAFNGEDYYSAPGQAEYLRQNEGELGNVLLNINIDGAGLNEGASCFSPFGLPEEINTALTKVIDTCPEIVEGLPWYQGDHSMFIQQGIPAIAVSSQLFIENMETQDITHTPKDNLSIVSNERVAECAIAITELIESL